MFYRLFKQFIFSFFVIAGAFSLQNAFAGSGGVVPVAPEESVEVDDPPPPILPDKAPVDVQPTEREPAVEQPPAPVKETTDIVKEVVVERRYMAMPMPTHNTSVGFVFSSGFGPSRPMGCGLPSCGNAFAGVQQMCGSPTLMPGVRPQCMMPVPNGYYQGQQGGQPYPYAYQQQNMYPQQRPMMMVPVRGIAQAPGNGSCGCQGMQGCGCGGGGQTMIINATPPPVWLTGSYQPRWSGFNYSGETVMAPIAPTFFRVPTPFEMPTNPRDIQGIPRAHGDNLFM